MQFFNEYVFPVLVCMDSNLSLGRLLPTCKHLYMAYAFSIHRSQVEALYKDTLLPTSASSSPRLLFEERFCPVERSSPSSDCPYLSDPSNKIRDPLLPPIDTDHLHFSWSNRDVEEFSSK